MLLNVCRAAGWLSGSVFSVPGSGEVKSILYCALRKQHAELITIQSECSVAVCGVFHSTYMEV